MDLAPWNNRLSQHFTQLRATRQARGKGRDRPVFALEHGLEPQELQELSLAVRAHARVAAPAREQALPWIVYAAEVGYRYSGDEYWQTFEAETPGWTIHGDRYWIRDSFCAFRTKFGGAEPSGSFTRFSIICWPITHAILPQDLQQQLARILYELRHSFSADLFESPATLGEFIAARSWNATSRFQQFVQETLLVGQIALALLLQGDLGTDSLIYPATLHRIGEDLDRKRSGREWLRDARKYALESARIRGLARAQGDKVTARRPDEARAEVAALGIEPRLVLRPTEATRSSWEVSLEIPDLSHLLVRFPQVHNILTGARCVVAGSAGRPLARGRCLHGVQRVALVRWPREDDVLLQFEQTDPWLEYLLRAECLLRPGPRWLFRVASDGLAYESRTMRARPGSRYVLISTSGPGTPGGLARPIKLNCEGVYGALLDLPSALTADWEETLKSLGITQARGIEVWPAGLAAVVWDGEGHGEWLASEQPCLAVRSDHQIDALAISMSDGEHHALELPTVPPGETVFVELPRLPIGLHRVRVAARSGASGEADVVGDLDVVMRIREARPWSPRISPHGPLAVEIYPAAPTLEQFWERLVKFAITGPAGRNVRCRVSMFERDGDQPSVIRQLPLATLPFTSERWRAHFEKHFCEAREAQNAYDGARYCEIEFSADELGAFTVRCDREFTPLRWTLRKVGQGQVVRLLDNVGTGSPVVERMSFERPSVVEALEVWSEYDVPAAGGLYVARFGEFTASIIVPPAGRGLTDLRCEPRLDERDRSVEAVLRNLELARLWGGARLPGDLFSATRQRLVLRAFTSHIFRLLGGDGWADAEDDVHRRHDGLDNLKRAISKKREEAGLGAALALDHTALATASERERVDRIVSLTSRFLSRSSVLTGIGTQQMSPGSGAWIRRAKAVGPDDSAWLVELALRLASRPVDVGIWAGEHLRAGIVRLLEQSILARASRFLVIAIDRQLGSRSAGTGLYAGWGWP